MCHMINLIVKNGEKIIDKNIKNIRDTIRFLKGSNDYIKSFRRFCKAHNISERLFGLDIPVR